MFKLIGTLFRKAKESENWCEVQKQYEEQRRAQAEAGDVLDLDAISEDGVQEGSDEVTLADVEEILSELDEDK